MYPQFSTSFQWVCIVVRAETVRRSAWRIASDLLEAVRYCVAFYRAMLCTRGTRYGPVSVCVCLSVTSRCSTKTAKRRIIQTTPHDTPGTLVFWCQRSPQNSAGVTPYEGAECRWGVQCFFVMVRAGTAYRKIWRQVNNFFARIRVHGSEIPIVLSNLFVSLFLFIELWHILILWLAKMPNGGMPVFTLYATGWRYRKIFFYKKALGGIKSAPFDK